MYPGAVQHHLTVMMSKKQTTSGTKKSVYGLTPEKIASLVAAGANEANFSKSLYQFTAQFVQHARDLAKTGQTDEARNWSRFFVNSHVVDVLKNLPKSGDLSALAESINFLSLECHSENKPDYTTDLEAIRGCLNEIIEKLNRNETTTKYTTPAPSVFLGSSRWYAAAANGFACQPIPAGTAPEN